MAAAKAELAGVWVLETTTGQFDDILAEQNVGWLARYVFVIYLCDF